MIYSRFVNYISMIRKNERPVIRALYSISANDVRTTTGCNIRKIQLHTGLDPMDISKKGLSGWRVYTPIDSWTVPLLSSLLQLRSDAWVVNFDPEQDEVLGDADIQFMIESICTG